MPRAAQHLAVPLQPRLAEAFHESKPLDEAADERILALAEKLSAIGIMPIITAEELAWPTEFRANLAHTGTEPSEARVRHDGEGAL